MKSLTLPFDDEELIEILYDETLPTFSIYFPKYDIKTIALDKLKTAPDSMNLQRRYWLDLSTMADLDIISIEDVVYASSPCDFYYNPSTNAYNNGGYGSGYDMLASMMISEGESVMLSSPITYWLEPPNTLYLDLVGQPFGTTLEFTFLTVHNKDLSSIKYTYYNFIMDLYLCDVQIALYNVMKRYDKIDATFGTVELAIDSWDGAEDRRKEILEAWNTEFLSHRRNTIYKA